MSQSRAPTDFAFLGAGSWLPETGRDTACLLIGGRCLVDTGWRSTLTLLDRGVDPCNLEALLFTHFHQDHYVGLPQLFFYLGMRWPRDRQKPFRVIGPSGELDRVVRTTREFLQWDRFPELRFPVSVEPIEPGEGTRIGNTELETIAARHVSGKGAPEQALAASFRIGDTHIVYSGDTSYNPDLARFARGASVLIHDAAHSTGAEAGQIAAAAGVRQLLLVHYPQLRASEVLEDARGQFAETYLAEDGDGESR